MILRLAVLVETDGRTDRQTRRQLITVLPNVAPVKKNHFQRQTVSTESRFVTNTEPISRKRRQTELL